MNTQLVISCRYANSHNHVTCVMLTLHTVFYKGWQIKVKVSDMPCTIGQTDGCWKMYIQTFQKDLQLRIHHALCARSQKMTIPTLSIGFPRHILTYWDEATDSGSNSNRIGFGVVFCDSVSLTCQAVFFFQVSVNRSQTVMAVFHKYCRTNWVY